MNLCAYLKKTNDIVKRREQKLWFSNLEERLKKGVRLYQVLDENTRHRLQAEFLNRVRTEEIKAWYSAPDGDSLFQGTSISSLTIPFKIVSPLRFNSMIELEEDIADAYIRLHNKYASKVKGAIIEDVEEWLKKGLYYGVVLSSKIISQALGLYGSHKEVIFKVGNYMVDPHEITSYPDDVRQVYFKECLRRIRVFEGLDLEQRELESSLVLADISKPKIDKYRDKIMLAPVKCNEIATLLSQGITARIRTKTSGKINPNGLAVIIYDTDTPYTYHHIMGYGKDIFSPVLPGLIVLGSSGTIDAFRWLYAYRVSLIAQKIMKGSLYSEVHKCFVPFVFFGVLVPRDAQILLNMDKLHMLRYRGNISADLEFTYLLPDYFKLIKPDSRRLSWKDLKSRHF